MKLYYITQKVYSLNSVESTNFIEKTGDEAYDFGGDKNDKVYFDFWQCYAHDQFTAEELAYYEDVILSRIKQVMPDVLRYSYTWNNMSVRFFNLVKSLGIKVVISVCDTLIYPNKPEIKLFQLADSFVVYDSISNYLRYRLLKENANGANTLVFAGGHQFDPIHLPELNLEKTFDVGMLGSVEGIRFKMIEFFMKNLKKLNIGFYSNGGYLLKDEKETPIDKLSDQFLTHDKYVETINKTKINIVSQTVPEREQIKCKIFEYMSCGAFALVDRNQEYEMLIPADVIVYYDSLEDCLEKIKYYLAHPTERERMAKRGQEWFFNNFAAGKFWNNIYTAVMNNTTLPIIPQVERAYTEIMDRVNIQHELYHSIHKMMKKPTQSSNTAKAILKKIIPKPVKNLIWKFILS